MGVTQKTAIAPVLLTNSDYYGTLAAVRSYGRQGIPVTVTKSRLLSVAHWSKYASSRVHAPSIQDAQAFLTWLLAFGKQTPGYVLYPTSDELAWLLATHREALSQYYKLYSPSGDCIYRLLNKKLLHAACQELEIGVPETFFPECKQELSQIARELPYPVIIKPQTQIFFESHIKGRIIYTVDELLENYTQFMQQNRYAADFLARHPSVHWPMLQRFYPEAAEAIYNLSGFIDETGKIFALKASRKVLQQPRRLGVGLCFEEDEVYQPLAEKLLALCKRVGYFGAFEVEFIQTKADNQFVLTDFNPRFYGQMAFDIARGLPLPELVYYAALGDHERVRSIVEDSSAMKLDAAQAFCHKVPFLLLLNTQKLSGKLSAAEVHRWQCWMERHKRTMAHAVIDPKDRLPAVVDTLSMTLWYLRHPGAFVRSIVLNR